MSNENTKQEVAPKQENATEYGPLSSEEFCSQKIDLGLRITVQEVLDHFGLEPEDLEGDHIIEYLSECILNDARIESFHPWDENRDIHEVKVGDALSLEF